MIIVEYMSTSGVDEALYALGKSYDLTKSILYSDFITERHTELRIKLIKLAQNLAPKENGHNSFLKMISATFSITAPRYMWQQVDTYKVGRRECILDCDCDDGSGISGSTMHTLGKRDLTYQDFPTIYNNSNDEFLADPIGDLTHKRYSIIEQYIDLINDIANIETEHKNEKLILLKSLLPEGFMQNRVKQYSYLALRNIVNQRENHKLPEWKNFFEIVKQIEFKELVIGKQ